MIHDLGPVKGLILCAVLALGSVACSNPCDDLEEQCGDCPGSDEESAEVEFSCAIVVAADDNDSCDAALDVLKCP